ncbi:MAG: T9SS type A sorting domain-containing protein [Bacteroidota bacterium]
MKTYSVLPKHFSHRSNTISYSLLLLAALLLTCFLQTEAQNNFHDPSNNQQMDILSSPESIHTQIISRCSPVPFRALNEFDPLDQDYATQTLHYATSQYSDIFVIDSVYLRSTTDTTLRINMYDSKGNITNQLIKKWSAGQWVNKTRFTGTYNTAGSQLTWLYEQWTSNAWVNSTRSTMTYDAKENMLSQMSETWTAGAWVNTSRYTYTYNADSKVTSSLIQQWTSGQWANSNRMTLTYDATGNMITRFSENWTTNQWVNGYRNSYTYDTRKNLLSELYEYYLNNQWTNGSRNTQTYSLNNYRLTYLSEIWTNNAWTNNARYTDTYDLNGNRVQEITEMWINSQWTTIGRGTTTYDEYANPLIVLSESWSGGQWTNSSRGTYTYTSDRLLSLTLNENWSAGQWVNNYRYSYTYGAEGMLILAKNEKWNSSVWIGYDEFFAVKDGLGKYNGYTGWYITVSYKSIQAGIVDPNPGIGVKSPFSNLVADISENHPKVNIRFHRSVASGNNIHTVWCETDTINSTLLKYLAYRRSTDGGRTFGAKKYLGSLTKISDPKGTEFIAVDGANVHIIILDLLPNADPVANKLLYFRSTDHGATFDAPKTIWSLNRSVGSLAMGDYYILANSGIVNIFGSMSLDHGSKDPVVVCYSSSDNGTTFTQTTNLTLLPEETYWWYWLFSDAVSQGSTMYALASDIDKVNSVERITFVKSTDGGKTFVYTPVSGANGSSAIHDLQWNNFDNSIESFHHKKMSVENNDVHIIWDQKDAGATQFDLLYRKSTNGGSSFSSVKNLTSALARDDNHFGSASIISKGNFVYITYNYNKGSWKIGLYYSKDKGETFSFVDLMIDTLFYAQDGRNAIPIIDPSSTGDQLMVVYAMNQVSNQKIGVTRFNATTGTISRKYYFPTNDFAYMSAPSPMLNADGSMNVIVHGDWPGMYEPRRLYSFMIEKEKPALGDNYAVRFDHVTDSQHKENIQIPYGANLNFASAFTIECWVKKLSNGQLLVAGKKGKGQDYYYYLGVSQNTNASNSRHPFARIATTTNTYDLSGYDKDSVTQNRWQHLAITYDANGGTNNFKLYLNGRVIDQKTTAGTLLNGPGCIFVNHMPDNWWSYPMGSALYDDLRFWSKARTAGEILALMNYPLTGNEVDLAAYYPMNGSLKEESGKGEDGIFNYSGYYERATFPTILGVEEMNESVPGLFSLCQNYPNPFNPSTTFRYSLPTASYVTLTVYDLLGREIASLVNEEQSAGWKEVQWNAGNISTGIYFYKLSSDNFIEIKKMMLLK